MKGFIVHLIVSALLLLLVAYFVPEIHLIDFGTALFAALFLGIVNGIVKPIMVLLTLPITIVTLGLFLLVVNALMFMLAAAVVPGFDVVGLWPATMGGLLLGVFNVIARLFIGN